MKFPDDRSISYQNIIIAKFKGPIFRKRAITQIISNNYFKIFHQIFYYISRYGIFNISYLCLSKRAVILQGG